MTISESIGLLPDSILHRRTMVDCQIRTFDVTDPGVIGRFLDVPRELFLPLQWKGLAYSDTAIEIKADTANGVARQLLPPLVLARLLQGCSLKADERVLDVASGTGYSTALLTGLAAEVISLESDSALASLVNTNLQGFGTHQVEVVKGPLAAGVANKAPYDVIFINGAVEAQLETLFGQLNEGGRLIAIQRCPGDPGERGSKAVRFEKIAGEISFRHLFDASASLIIEFQKSPQFVF